MRKYVERDEFVQERKPADMLAVMEPLDPDLTSEISEELGGHVE
ncbi:hypothetical protein [Haladaptatus sp. W1]|nr:hypothetical protein [Haladaptatus sp. W1]